MRLLTEDDVRAFLGAACRRAGTAVAFAQSLGFSAAYLSDVLRGRRAPGPGLLEAIGMERVTAYRRRGRGPACAALKEERKDG